MHEREKRLRSYAPLWGMWTPGGCLYAGETASVFELTRTRCDKALTCTVKMIEIRSDDPRELDKRFAAAVDEIERMELLSPCPHIITKLDDDVRELRGPSGALEGYDLLIRMESLTCLADLMRDGETLDADETRRLGRQLCRALSYAHTRGFVHRDVKPANIYRGPDGGYQLGDFGVSASSTLGRSLHTIAGTTAYMAPEVALGRPYDHRADLYSLGIVLYQLLNNNFLPFTGEFSTFGEREDAIRRRHGGSSLPVPPHGDAFLQQAVLCACTADPEKRYPSAEAFYTALGAAQKRRRTLGPPVAAGLCALCFALGLALPPVARALLPKAPLPNTAPDFADPGDAPEAYRGASAYEVIRQPLTWENARTYCESRGGHLATITSRQEESEILALLDESGLQAAWIGANNRNSARGFSWVTGERFAYAAWGPNEPNNTNGIEYYLMLQKRDGQWTWNDSRDDGLTLFSPSLAGFVCEWDNSDDDAE